LARWWSGGGISTARQWIASLGEEVSPVELDGAPAWMLAADIREVQKLPPSRSVRLLPTFDQYVIAASGGTKLRAVGLKSSSLSFRRLRRSAAQPNRKPSASQHFSAAP
jgi:hypothetical protein